MKFEERTGFGNAAAAVASEAEAKCVVVTESGARYFAAGGDIRDLASVRAADETAAVEGLLTGSRAPE